MSARRALGAFVAALLACHPGGAPGDAETLRVAIGGEPFDLELALDAPARQRGLGGRDHVAPRGGMLFAFPRSHELRFVMRDCTVPIDIAFLDAEGRVVAVHEMRPEAPRGEGESAAAYELRLPTYSSVFPARFAIETAGGRLAELGVVVGQRIEFDRDALLRRAR